MLPNIHSLRTSLLTVYFLFYYRNLFIFCCIDQCCTARAILFCSVVNPDPVGFGSRINCFGSGSRRKLNKQRNNQNSTSFGFSWTGNTVKCSVKRDCSWQGCRSRPFWLEPEPGFLVRLRLLLQLLLLFYCKYFIFTRP